MVAPRWATAGTQESPALAVLYFDNNSGDSELDVLSKGFADMLITDLSSTGVVTVVEREKLQALLQEVKVQRNKFFDRKTAVKLGKGLGARYVVSGSFMQVKPLLRIDVRLIEVATSKVILATQVKGATESVFDLEQQLVSNFMEKLNHRFSAARLPATKIPNLKTLLSYSESLALVDKGDTAKAAALMQKVVSQAPLFGLARSRHEEFIKRIATSQSRRDVVRSQGAQALYAEAKAFIKAHPLATLTKNEASFYLGYRALLGLEFATALRPRLVGKVNSLAVPRQKPGPAVALMNAYYNHHRKLLLEVRELESRFGEVRPNLPGDAYANARKLGLRASGTFPSERLLDFVLKGRVPKVGEVESYSIAPPLANIDPKIAKAAKALVVTESARVSTKSRTLEAHQARVIEALAAWHFNGGRVEEGIVTLQTVIDRFPNYHGWKYAQTRIKEQLGLKHNHYVSRRLKYESALSACDPSDYNVGLSGVFSMRIRGLGLLAGVRGMEKELRDACRKDAKYPKMQKYLMQDIFLAAAKFDDCAWFDLYLKKWLALGGSKGDAAGYRKNWSRCP